MNKMILANIVLLFGCCIYAQDKSIVNAWKHGARVETFVRVVDELGCAVSNASICVAFSNSYSPVAKDPIQEGLTDENGLFNIRGRCKYCMTINAVKDSYYRGWHHVQLDAMTNTPAVVNGIWRTDTNGYVVVMKRAKKPILLRHCPQRNHERKIPVLDKWIAYDFNEWDFCSPYGEGKNEDVLFRFTENKNGKKFADHSIELSFTNHPYAGFYVRRKDESSELRYDYMAQTNKTAYVDYVKYETILDEKGCPVVETKLNSDEYMMFRTRTTLDSEDNIVHANYGRILGPLRYDEFGGAGYVRFPDGWFNPNDSDSNLEDIEHWRQILRRRKKSNER